jgi:hypothetical protein
MGERGSIDAERCAMMAGGACSGSTDREALPLYVSKEVCCCAMDVGLDDGSGWRQGGLGLLYN